MQRGYDPGVYLGPCQTSVMVLSVRVLKTLLASMSTKLCFLGISLRCTVGFPAQSTDGHRWEIPF